MDQLAQVDIYLRIGYTTYWQYINTSKSENNIDHLHWIQLSEAANNNRIKAARIKLGAADSTSVTNNDIITLDSEY